MTDDDRLREETKGLKARDAIVTCTGYTLPGRGKRGESGCGPMVTTCDTMPRLQLTQQC